MKRILYRFTKALGYSLPLIVALFVVASCADDNIVTTTNEKHNFSMSFATRSPESDQVVNNVQLYTFYNNPGYSNDSTFHRKLLNITRNTTTSTVSASVETGDWYLAMVAPPTGVSFIEPTGNTSMAELPMYKYEPVYDGSAGRHPNAPEHLYFVNDKLPFTITANQAHTHNTQLNRNVGMVRVKLNKTTANFDKDDTTHKITLHSIPTTISYTGALLPEKNKPDTITGGVSSLIKLVDHTETGYLRGEKNIEFIIPAHRGTDFLEAAPKDTTTMNMYLTIDLLRTGASSRFTKTVKIDKVARCNGILEVNVTVNDGVLVKSEVLPWERADMGGTVGAEYKNWLYVKKDATGTGASWSDAAPSIGTAITRAQALMADGKTVHGILVATGEGGTTYTYDEALTIPANIRIFGGWEGKPNTELAANDANAPYTSTNRMLGTKKVRLNTGTNSVILNAGSVLDGFIITGSGTGNGLVTLTQQTSWINAIEIEQQTINASNALYIDKGKATNVLITRNNKGVSVTGSGKLINGTITNNGGTSNINGGIVYNTIFWPANPTINGSNDIQFSAFVGEINTIPQSGAINNNIHINSSNTAWFSASITAPGPHFKESNDSEHYKAQSNRAPMLGRGNEELYSNAIGQTLDKDINGNKRYDIDPQDNSKMLMDIGCYEDISSLTGFRLTWASERLYISAKGGYSSNIPLMLPKNNDPETQIDVDWGVTILSSSTWSTYEGITINTLDKVVVGTVKFKNPGATPNGDYTLPSERRWGQIEITTNLGGYLPNTKVDIYQVPGANTVWQNGYAGSFHRNNEVGARYIHAYNTGDWEVRILSGLEWIKIDTLEKDEGTPINDPQEGTPPGGGNYREVQEIWGGAVKGTGNIKFRVGMKSKNPNPAEPRYGLIVISRTGGSAMFFVRQGEADDFLYRKDDPRVLVNTSTDLKRTQLVKFSPYNLTDPNGNTSASLSPTTVDFTKYPTQVGYYFRWNQNTGYSFNCGQTITSSTTSSWNKNNDICPTNYRHPSQYEFIHTIYDKASDTAGSVSATGANSENNFMWGAYADGYYDQLAGDDLAQAPTDGYSGRTNKFYGSRAGIAGKGILMVSHYDYGSIFFPAGGVMGTDGLTAVTKPQNPNQNLYRTIEYVMIWAAGTTTYGGGSNVKRNTHWSWRDGGDTAKPHIGMNCTPIEYGDTTRGPQGLGNVRCVLK